MKRILVISSLAAALMAGSFIVSAQAPPSDPAQPAPNPAQQNHTDSNDQSKGQDLVGDRKPTTANSLNSPATVGQDKTSGNNLVGENKGQVQNSGNVHPDFRTLDVKKRGYLTTDDVKGEVWLSSNFSRCNSSRDGHLTAHEYALCLN